MKTRIVGLDLETTSLNPHSGDIIEIGACIYEDGKKISTFQRLLKPTEDIPRYVSGLTGIGPEDVSDAPLFNEVKDELFEYVGDLPIIGHNIFFDIGFLKAKGIDFSENAIYDTWKLATLVIDSSPSLSLEVLSRHLNISHADTHRALDDAVASVELFYELIRRVDSLSTDALEVVTGYLDTYSDNTYAPFFVSAHAEKNNAVQQKSLNKMSGDVTERFDIEMQELEHFFETQKSDDVAQPLSVKQFEAVKILSSRIEISKNTYIDCPKDVNQVLAALLAAGLSDQKCIILVQSVLDRDTLFNSDVTALQDITGKPFHPLFLGRPHEYFCKRRFDEFIARNNHTEDEQHIIIKMLLWLRGTRTGLLSEVNTVHGEYKYLEAFRSDDALCDEEKCTEYGGCYYHAAKTSAQDAQIVVSWHSVLFEKDSSIDVSGRHILVTSTEKIARSYVSHEKLFRTAAAISAPITFLRNFLQAHAKESSTTHVARLEELIGHIDLTLGLIGVHSKSYAHISYDRIQVNAEFISFLVENSLKSTIEKTRILFEELRKNLADSELLELFPVYVPVYIEKIDESVTQFISFFELSDTVLREISLGEEHIFLNQVPIVEKISPFQPSGNSMQLLGLNSIVRKKRVVGTILDISSSEEVHIHSDIDYSENVNVYAITDTPAENDETYLEYIHEIVAHTYAHSDEGVVVILKNKGKIANYFKRYGLENKKGPHSFFYMGVSGGASKVKGMMMGVQKPILFTTTQYLQSMRVQSEFFSTFIIDRLPFQPPSPYEIQMGGGDFMNGALPRALDTFKDIFDITLAHKHDTASFIVLDPKATKARYASHFFEEIEQEGFSKISFEQLLHVENF